MNYAQLFFEVDACISCGQCQLACPVTQVTGVARAPNLDPLFPAFGSRWNLFTHREASSFCTQCGRCREVCPRGIDLPRVLAWVRSEAGSRELAPVETMLNRLERYDSPYGRRVSEEGRFSRRLSRKGGAQVLFYPGCATLEGDSRVPEAWDFLAGQLGVDYTTLGTERACCGSLYYHWGQTEAFERRARKLGELFRELEPGTAVVTDCPHCLFTFRHLYPELGVEDMPPVEHVWEYLLRAGGDSLRFSLERGRDAAFLQPCFLRSMGSWTRDEIGAIGRLFPETAVLGDGHCCGAGEGLEQVHPEVAAALGESVEASVRAKGRRRLFTGCPHCRRQLQDQESLAVTDLLEAVAGAMGK